jgi:hypothetical protein
VPSIFDPDLFIVDKEPLGLRGEVEETLRPAEGARRAADPRACATSWTSPALLAPEWTRKNVVPALRDLYDEHLGLRPAADLRSARRRRAAALGAAQDDAIPAISGAACRRAPSSRARLRRSPSPSCW